MGGASRRVRVTADLPAQRSAAFTRGIALPGARVDEADVFFVKALVRSQLRLALGVVAGFVLVVVALALVIALVADLDQIIVGGVPLPWLLQAYAFYPVVIVFAVIYVRAAARNERRYRTLRDRE